MATKNKVIITGHKARTELVRGADFLAEAIKSTLGPFGQNFFLEKGNKITNDGKTIASEMEHREEIPQRGLSALREAAMKTDAEVGDGTTTATVLAQAILKASIKELSDGKTFVGKTTSAELIKKIEKERKHVTSALIGMATMITTEIELVEAARVSVEDEDLAKLIGEAQWKLGPEGVIIAEETIDPVSSIEMVSGIQIDNGYGTSLVMNNIEKQTLEVNNVRVLLTNHTFQNLKPIEALGKQLARMGIRDLVIVARAFSNEAIKECLENHKAGFCIWPVNAPYTDQTEIMKDLAAVLGGRYVNVEAGSITDAIISDLGFASRIVSTRSSCIFTGMEDEMTKPRIEARVEELNKKLSGTVSDFEKRHVNQRLAQLTKGFAVLKIGANSAAERGYKKDKADDACNAARVCLQEGVVPGAGQAFLKISEDMKDDSILKFPLRSIYDQIMSTAPEGFEIESWVKDPVKVLRVALEKACSVAGTLATACGAIATEKDKPMWVQQVQGPQEEDEDTLEL